jgi:hypothetical protein
MKREKTSHICAECGYCKYFRNDAAYLERAFAGLNALSSAFGSTRSSDGICTLHDRYLSARSFCAEFAPASPTGASA